MKMFDDIQESELLALVEDELDPAADRALRERLTKHLRGAEILAWVDQMREDRMGLREVGELALPCDFVAELEQQLARPMLLEGEPGSYRRKKHLEGAWMRRVKYAAVAGIGLMVVSGGWLGVGRAMEWWDSMRVQMAQNGDEDAAGLPGSERVMKRDGGGDVLGDHAGGASGTESGTMVDLRVGGSSSTMPDLRRGRGKISGEPLLVTTDLALVISASDDAVISMLSRVVFGRDQEGALARNFSLEEATELEEQWRLAQARPGRESLPAFADITADRGGVPAWKDQNAEARRRMARRVREQIRAMKRESEGEPGDRLKSGRLAGFARLMPSFEQQLDYSARGASYTLCVRASELGRVLEELAVEEGVGTRLMILGAGGVVGNAHPTGLQDWLSTGARVRAVVEGLEGDSGEGFVLLPVVVGE